MVDNYDIILYVMCPCLNIKCYFPILITNVSMSYVRRKRDLYYSY